MVTIKRQDELVRLIAALLCDIQKSHETVFNTRSLRLTVAKLKARHEREGNGFITKTLPRLGKALDRALSSESAFDCSGIGFKTQPRSRLPRFLGEFFNRIFDPSGTVLPDPCASSVGVIRQVVYVFYKYKLDYSTEQEESVIQQFVKTEEELAPLANKFANLANDVAILPPGRWVRNEPSQARVVKQARILLARVFQAFSFTDIIPRHGPGAVSTKEKLWSKYIWTNVSERITQYWPLDEYFFSSINHVCDRLDSVKRIKSIDHSAKVVLVPKDSRGPRLISCEPVDFQWIQQGIMTRLVEHVEKHPLTSGNVFFTDQTHNRCAARYGSINGRYATLDLKEASDRVSTSLVRLLFPSDVTERLEAARSLSTRLPDGKILPLHKFAPMGSALCFPILALTIWSILSAAAPDAYTRERILVYGDDVIVPTAYAANAMQQLESFGLLINRDKSCLHGFFRESCGMDAFKGFDVTPVRVRTVWTESPSPDAYVSWIAYANSLYDRGYFTAYDYIVELLHLAYGELVCDDMRLACPSLREVPDSWRPKRTRTNKRLQKQEFKVRDVKAPSMEHHLDGWLKLLRYHTERGRNYLPSDDTDVSSRGGLSTESAAWSSSRYTKRRTNKFVLRWR